MKKMFQSLFFIGLLLASQQPMQAASCQDACLVSDESCNIIALTFGAVWLAAFAATAYQIFMHPNPNASQGYMPEKEEEDDWYEKRQEEKAAKLATATQTQEQTQPVVEPEPIVEQSENMQETPEPVDSANSSFDVHPDHVASYQAHDQFS